MTTIECPFCDGPLPIEAIGDAVACDGCNVIVDVAPDPAIELAAAA